jgi:acyl dehydratase
VGVNELATAPVVHDGLPSPSLIGAVLRRRAGLRDGDALPPLAVSARGVRRDPSAYARICGFPVADPLPPTFPQVLAAPLHLALLGDARFPLPVLGLVHVAQRIVVHRPIAASDTLDVSARVSEHRIVRAGAEFDILTDVNIAGERVWEGTTTILSRAVRGSGPKVPVEEPAFRPRRSVVIRVPEDIGRRYGAVAGDQNPIHLHAWTARLFGFPRAIAHGMWTLARALAELDRDVPPTCTIEVRFLKPVFLPSRVTVSGGPLVVGDGIGFAVRNEKGAACVTGTIQG